MQTKCVQAVGEQLQPAGGKVDQFGFVGVGEHLLSGSAAVAYFDLSARTADCQPTGNPVSVIFLFHDTSAH